MANIDALGTLACTKCGETKALKEFYKDKRNTARRGRGSWCKQCKDERDRAWREANPEYARKWREANSDAIREYNRKRRESDPEGVRKYSRQWTKEHPERNAEYKRRWRRTHMAKATANERLWGAVRRGTIKKPSYCLNCGCACEPTHLHGHHKDYSRPLDVEWLCRQCHNEVHNERKHL